MSNFLDKKIAGAVTWRSLVTFACAVAVFFVLAWIYFSPNVAQGDELRQNDVLQGLANGHEGQLYSEKHDGEITRWTNSLFGGMPTFQINPTYASNTPLKWVHKVLTLGLPEPVNWVFLLMLGFFILLLSFKTKWYVAILGAIGYAFSSYFFIIIGAGHIWKLVVLAYIPPTIAGMVLAYRGKYLLGGALTALFASMQLLYNHTQMTYYSLIVIIALAIAFLVKAILDKKVARWAIASGVLAVAAGVAALTSLPNLYFTYEYAKETMRGGHSELTAPAGKETTPESRETPTSSGLTKEYITQWSYGVDETMTLLVPNAKGGTSMASLAETDAYQELNDAGEVDQVTDMVMPVFSQYFGDQPFTSGPVYVGALIFLLFVLGIMVVRGPVKWALLVATLLSIALSWGHNMMWLTDFFIDYVPMYNKFRTVSSILVVAEFTMPLLAALALNKILTTPHFWASYKKECFVALGVVTFFCILLAVAPGVMGGGVSDSDARQLLAASQGQVSIDDVRANSPSFDTTVTTLRHYLVSSDAWRSLLFVLAGSGVLAIFFFVTRKDEKVPSTKALGAGILLTLLVVADMYPVNKRYLNSDNFVEAVEAEGEPFQATAADRQILQDPDPNYRVMDLTGFSSPRSSYFHKTVGGYHAAKLSRYNDLIERQIMGDEMNMDVLNMLNAKWFISSGPDGQPMAQRNPEALGNAWFVDTLTYVDNADKEMAFLNDFNPATTAVADAKYKNVLGEATPKAAGDTIYLTAYEANRLVFHSHSAQGGVAVLSEVYFPWGWKAVVDGKDELEIGRVNYVLRALRVPAGDHDIELTFKPTQVESTITVARIAIGAIFLALIAALLVALLKRKKGDDDKSDDIYLDSDRLSSTPVASSTPQSTPVSVNKPLGYVLIVIGLVIIGVGVSVPNYSLIVIFAGSLVAAFGLSKIGFKGFNKSKKDNKES